MHVLGCVGSHVHVRIVRNYVYVLCAITCTYCTQLRVRIVHNYVHFQYEYGYITGEVAQFFSHENRGKHAILK